MMWVRFLMPATSIVVLTIAAALPWELPASYRLALPLLPVVAIYYWALDPDAPLPEWLVFLAGLSLDVLTQGPLGYWAIVYLFAYVIAIFASRINAGGGLARMVLLACAVIAIASFAWLAASVYFLAILNPEPYIKGAISAILLAILISPVFDSFRSTFWTARATRLTRGG